jgi:hypothetical protein
VKAVFCFGGENRFFAEAFVLFLLKKIFLGKTGFNGFIFFESDVFW